MNQSAKHSALVHDIKLALGQIPGLVLWSMSPGGVHDAGGRPMRCGPNGMADLCGIMAPLGTWFCLEVKTGRAKQSVAQRQWEQIITSHGGFYSVVWSVEDALRAVTIDQYVRSRMMERIEHSIDGEIAALIAIL